MGVWCSCPCTPAAFEKWRSTAPLLPNDTGDDAVQKQRETYKFLYSRHVQMFCKNKGYWWEQTNDASPPFKSFCMRKRWAKGSV